LGVRIGEAEAYLFLHYAAAILIHREIRLQRSSEPATPDQVSSALYSLQ